MVFYIRVSRSYDCEIKEILCFRWHVGMILLMTVEAFVMFKFIETKSTVPALQVVIYIRSYCIVYFLFFVLVVVKEDRNYVKR